MSRPRDDYEEKAAFEDYVNRPRTSCKEIAPELLRLHRMQNARTRERKLRVLKKMLQRARTSDVTDKLQKLIEFDKSESIIPHGEVSKRMYNEIFKQRKYDMFARRTQKIILSDEEEAAMNLVAKQMGKSSLSEEKTDVVEPPNLFANITGDIKAPPITTAQHKIGFQEVYNPPVGFASNPSQPFKSYGHEKFFAYDGDWEKGKMSGLGLFQYIDGSTYKGAFKNNKPQGRGHAKYSTGSEYDGEWHQGKFGGGKGTMRLRGGSVYTGHFKNGRREGTGKLEYPSGLVYEGEFHDGKPHGRGKVTSKLTGYSYEGEFKNGSIQGSGALETPGPSKERIVEFWREVDEVNKTLPSIVMRYIEEKRLYEESVKQHQEELYAPLRGANLREYVEAVRKNLHEERARLKRERQEEELRKIKEAKAKLMEARLKALAGE